jgi:hypothetical protein
LREIVRPADGHRAVFAETRAPTQSEIAEVTRRARARVLRELERRGMLRDPNDARNEAENEPIIGCAQLTLRVGKLGRVDAHGQVKPDDMDLDARFARRGKPFRPHQAGSPNLQHHLAEHLPRLQSFVRLARLP